MAGCIFGGASSCVQDLAQDAVTSMAQSFADSAGWAVKHLTGVWLGIASPDVGASSMSGWLSGRLGWFVLAAAFVSVLWAAYRMATSGSFEHLSGLAWSLGRLVAIAGTVSVATTLALQVGDAVAAWVLAGVKVQFDPTYLLGASSTVPPGMVLILAAVVIIAQLAQAILMLVKNAMVVLLVGFLPLTAAATNTPIGQNGFQKAVTWLAAFVLYKPVAAVIYAVSFKLASRDNTITGQLSGVALMLLAIFALPALMRFLVPVTAAATGGNAGALAGAAVGASVATGAVLVTGGGGVGFAAAAPAAAQSAPTGAQLGAAPAATGATASGATSSGATTSDDTEAAA